MKTLLVVVGVLVVQVLLVGAYLAVDSQDPFNKKAHRTEAQAREKPGRSSEGDEGRPA